MCNKLSVKASCHYCCFLKCLLCARPCAGLWELEGSEILVSFLLLQSSQAVGRHLRASGLGWGVYGGERGGLVLPPEPGGVGLEEALVGR